MTGGEHGDETVVGGGGELLGRGSEEDWEEQEACTNTESDTYLAMKLPIHKQVEATYPNTFTVNT